jgi:hypothetical protein
MRLHNLDRETFVKLDADRKATWGRNSDLQVAVTKARALIDFLEEWIGAVEEQQDPSPRKNIQELISRLDASQKRRLKEVRKKLIPSLQDEGQSELDVIKELRTMKDSPKFHQILDVLELELTR